MVTNVGLSLAAPIRRQTLASHESCTMTCRGSPQAFPTTAKACNCFSWCLGFLLALLLSSHIVRFFVSVETLQDVDLPECGARQGSGETQGGSRYNSGDSYLTPKYRTTNVSMHSKTTSIRLRRRPWSGNKICGSFLWRQAFTCSAT
jgi:hypothetical protein